MSSARFPIPQGTLDMLILQILSLEPAHGYGIAQRLEQISKSVVQINQGSLYPALHRLEQKGWLKADLDRELQYHIDRRVTDLIHSGLPEPEARRRVALELGGATQVREEVRDIWLTRWLRDFVYDLRFSARSFRRSPSFTATALLSLALGIGATTALYSLIDQIVLRALS